MPSVASEARTPDQNWVMNFQASGGSQLVV
jgi:hypothetical protein